MIVEGAPRSYDSIPGDSPADWSNMPGERTVDSDLNLNDRNQRRRFRRKFSSIIDKAKEEGKDLLAIPEPSSKASNKVKLLIGVGIAAGGIIGARTLYKHRQKHNK